MTDGLDRTSGTRTGQEVAVCWRGWSTVVLDFGRNRVVCDPMRLSGSDPGLFGRGPDGSTVKVTVLVSHEHGDHFDLACLQALEDAGATIYGSAGAVQRARGHRLTITRVQVGDVVCVDEVRIEIGPCEHVSFGPVTFAIRRPGGPTLFVPHDSDASERIRDFMASMAGPAVLVWAGSSAYKLVDLIVAVRPDLALYPSYTGRHYEAHVAAQVAAAGERAVGALRALQLGVPEVLAAS